MGKPKTIDAFFGKKATQNNNSNNNPAPPTACVESSDAPIIAFQERPFKAPRLQSETVDISTLERDPGLRRPIWEYPIYQQDEVRRFYIKAGPYQPILSKYPQSGPKNRLRNFKSSWFSQFPNWLEYSSSKDAAFCLPCYVFCCKPTSRSGGDVFTIKGFQNWKKVNDGKNCSFLIHVGDSPNSSHNNAIQCCDDLMVQSQHIDKVLAKHSSQQIVDNRLRLKTSVDAVKWLTFQACPLRGNDESFESSNRGNFIELVKLLASYSEDVNKVVLENAPQNAQYIAPNIQKQILHIIARKVRCIIRESIGDARFCILVDESRDESMREQMAIVIRYVDKNGIVQERFFGLVHVLNTSAATLKDEISCVFSQHNLNVDNLRGQGYDGASNMRGEWNGLQALFLKECPYAYYVHCFAHRLQLALVGASRDVKVIQNFFSNLSFIINVVDASSKRRDELRVAQAANIAAAIATDELQTGSGLNQIGSLQRAGDTRWGSHLKSIRSLVCAFDATCRVLDGIIFDSKSGPHQGDAQAALNMLTSFEFIFTLHLMMKVLGITDDLCQALQNRSQDVVNAINLVSTTKSLIQMLRESGWDELLKEVKSFCEGNDVYIPDMHDRYIPGRGRYRRQDQHVDIEHHYKYDVFIAAIDSQLQELNSRFNESTMELLSLSLALDPRDNYRLFNIDDICKLVDKFYPCDFTEQEKIHLRIQLQHYKLDVSHHQELKDVLTISELSQRLVKTGKSVIYHLVFRLIKLVLTLPVSTATTERSFSAMKIVKTSLRNKMEDEYLADYLITYIEKKIVMQISTDSIIDDFYDMKNRRIPFR